MKIKLAFYKNSKTFFGRLIRLNQYRLQSIPWKHSKYSHVELVFGNKSFSSSETDGGTRFKKIKWKKKNWDFVNIEITEKEYEKVLAFCKKEEGQKYNWIGIFAAQIFNFNKTRDGNWFCSQICCRALQESKKFCGVSAHLVSPAQLHIFATK